LYTFVSNITFLPQLLEKRKKVQFANFHETSYRHYTTRRHPDILLLVSCNQQGLIHLAIWQEIQGKYSTSVAVIFMPFEKQHAQMFFSFCCDGRR
jgi:hypothetical protein